MSITIELQLLLFVLQSIVIEMREWTDRKNHTHTGENMPIFYYQVACNKLLLVHMNSKLFFESEISKY